MDFRVFSRNISENMHARCVREDTKQALKGNLQADGVHNIANKTKSHTISNKVETAWLFEKHGGECGIRTHVPFRTTAFRVQLVMTTSITLQISA